MTGPLFPLSATHNYEMFDQPANYDGKPGSFTAVASVGVANRDRSTLDIKGSMTYGYKIDAKGNVTPKEPRVSTQSERAHSVDALRRDSPKWSITY